MKSGKFAVVPTFDGSCHEQNQLPHLDMSSFQSDHDTKSTRPRPRLDPAGSAGHTGFEAEIVGFSFNFSNLAYQPDPFAKAYSHWTLVHICLAAIQDLTQKLNYLRAISMSLYTSQIHLQKPIHSGY